jgi:hypothetical protein
MINAAGNIAMRVRTLASDVMADPRHVRIDLSAAQHLGSDVRRNWEVAIWDTLPLSPADTVIHELAASAVNYAFWYGGYKIRPGMSASSSMYRLLAGAAYRHMRPDDSVDWARAMPSFAADLSSAGFPHAEARTRHLMELLSPLEGVTVHGVADKVLGTASMAEVLEIVIRNFPGFAGDPFGKRIILFAMQAHRRLGLWDEEVSTLPVAADYQQPRLLRHHGILRYQPELAAAVDAQRLIPAGSQEECEIRAATVIACDAVAKAAGLRPSDIDAYLWLRRDEPTKPFHLTMTTHY